ncbi:MAG: hypothetical protein CMP23_04325 [Rickettsiales bacterium]|nr:hypothetical protein [Rickettsiales bacterium]
MHSAHLGGQIKGFQACSCAGQDPDPGAMNTDSEGLLVNSSGPRFGILRDWPGAVLNDGLLGVSELPDQSVAGLALVLDDEV